MKEKKTGDLILRIFIMIFCIAYYVIAIPYKQSAKLMPQLVAIVTFILTALTFVGPLVERIKGAKENEPSEEEGVNKDKTVQPQIKGFKSFVAAVPRWVLLYVFTVLFFLLLKVVGFVICSLLYIPVMMYLMGHKNHLTIWLFTVLFTLVLYFSFTKIFHVSLPLGILRFLG